MRIIKFSKMLMIGIMGLVMFSSCSKDDDGNEQNGGISSSGDANLLPGKFSVSPTKQVRFTKGNLYWDGEKYRLESDQLYSPQKWNPNHVSHFFWSNSKDYNQKGLEPYAEKYSYLATSNEDIFWCGEKNPLTVEGTKGLYALTGEYQGEWDYLLKERNNAEMLYRNKVIIGSRKNCLVIAPDNFTGTIELSYTNEEWKTAEAHGLVCIVPAGDRNGGSVFVDEYSTVEYWTSSLTVVLIAQGGRPSDGEKYFVTRTTMHRDKGLPVRLVQTVTK